MGPWGQPTRSRMKVLLEGLLELKQPSMTTLCSGFRSVLTTLILVLNLYLASLLLRPFQQQQPGMDSSSCGFVQLSPALPQDFVALKKAGLLVDSPFRTAGVFVHSVVLTGAYRTGPAGWAVVGLGATPVFRDKAKAELQCVWLDADADAGRGRGVASQTVRWDTPGLNYAPGAYLTLAIDCVFANPVGANAGGGALLLRVSENRQRMGDLRLSTVQPMVGWSGPADRDAWMFQALQPQVYSAMGPGRPADHPIELVAATERPRQYDPATYSRPYRYHNLYCGSPLHTLHGNLSVQAVMEWLSYHYHFLGTDSHFVLHDAGALRTDPPMLKALEPWIQLGIVVVENVENLLHFDTFYYNQNLILNDCLHKYKHAAERLWFFDVDEYIVIRPPHTLQSIVTDNADVDILKFQQLKFSDRLCRPESRKGVETRWNAESLFFRKGADHPGEQKYVMLNPRNILSAGIHEPFQSTLSKGTFSQRVLNITSQAAYYHYHDTIMAKKADLCSMLLPPKATKGKANTTGLASRRGFLYDWEYDDAILPQVVAAKSYIKGFFAARKIPSPV